MAQPKKFEKGIVRKDLVLFFNEYEKQVRDIVTKNSILLTTYIRKNFLQGGTTSSKLKKRSGKLQSSTTPIPTIFNANTFKGGVRFGAAYAGTHIGKKGEQHVITPKNKKYLTIPLPAALTSAGVLRGPATDESQYGNTFVRRSKKGNLIIFGQGVNQKGSNAGKVKGKIIPLFLLKKKVVIETRVDALSLIKWLQPKIEKDLERI